MKSTLREIIRNFSSSSVALTNYIFPSTLSRISFLIFSLSSNLSKIVLQFKSKINSLQNLFLDTLLCREGESPKNIILCCAEKLFLFILRQHAHSSHSSCGSQWVKKLFGIFASEKIMRRKKFGVQEIWPRKNLLKGLRLCYRTSGVCVLKNKTKKFKKKISKFF